MTLVIPSDADVLRGIADEIDRDPSIWTQGAYLRDADGNKAADWAHRAVCGCAMGLLSLAVGYGNSGYSAIGSRHEAFLRDAIDAKTGMRNGVENWNDEPGRTPDEVANMFRYAGNLAEAAA